MKYIREIISPIIGAILGVFCVLGAKSRFNGWEEDKVILIGLWYNRVYTGLMIGFTNQIKFINIWWINAIIRGSMWGALLSLAFYLDTDFEDITTFLMGIVWALLMDLIATALDLKFGNKEENATIRSFTRLGDEDNK